RAAGGCAGLSALTGGVRAASCNGARGRQPGIKTAPDRGLTWARALHSFAQLRQNRQNQLLFEVPNRSPLTQVGQNRTHALQRKSAKLSTIASAGGSKRSSESGSIRLVMTAPPIIDGGWFQASFHHQPGLQIFHPQTNYKVTVWRN